MQPKFPQNSDEIILAKLVAPELPSNYVRRPYLFSQFLKGLSRKIVLVSSPAGFGKTTLLSEWYRMLPEHGEDYRTIWVTLDRDDDDSIRFWAHLTASLKKVFPGIGDDVSFSRQPPSEDDEKEVLDRSIIRLSNYLHENAASPGGEFVLFFDNIDALSDHFFAKLVDYFSVYLPSNFRVVAAGSVCPSVSIDYQRMGSVYEFPAGDIAFSRQELTSFMANKYGSAASEQLVQELYSLTQGWATGIRLFSDAVELHELKNMRVLDKNLLYSLVDKYFASFIIKQIEDDCASFLIATSVLERMSAPLCDCLRERDDSHAILADLSEKSFFIEPCQGKAGWYQYHPLFLRWLRTKLFQMRTPQIRELSSRAQDWYEREKLPYDAAKYMLMASDPEMIDNLAAAAHFQRGDTSVSFLSWMCDIPAKSLIHDATLSLYVTRGYLSYGRATDTLKWLSVFQQNLQDGKGEAHGADDVDSSQAADLVIKHIRIKCREFSGHYRECIADYKKLLDAQATINLSLRVLIVHAIAESYERIGEFGLALEYYLQTEAIANLAGSPFFVAFGRYAICWILVHRGELNNAEATCQRALEDCPTDFTLYGALQSLYAYIMVEKNDLKSAEANIRQATRNLSLNRNADMLFEAQIVTASYMAALGNLDEAYRQIVRTVLLVENADIPRAVLLFAYVTQAKLALQRKNVEDAVMVHKKLINCVDPSDLFYVIRTKQLEAFILYDQGDEAALTFIDGLIGEAAEASFNTIVVESLLFKALLLNEQGKKSDALLVLNRAVLLGSRLGLVRPFLDRTMLLRELLHEVVNIRKVDGVNYNFIKNILKSLKVSDIIDKPSKEMAPDATILTRREIEVLDLLNVGMSRQEIAETLGVSHNTIKTHLNSIYSKLGVKNRTEVFKLTHTREDR
ncbi:MAG: LuxR C-terminal-related transcriptional regulator [Coriobacteriaceae bacterium]|nr:LuxR C-terminal-related transcriptional regulator [Coriobacteriaceae bacterium]